MTNSEQINILDITSDVTEAPPTEVATDEVTTGETPPFGSADSAVVVKMFEDYRGRSKQEAIDYALELKDGFLYTVERLKRQEYRQTSTTYANPCGYSVGLQETVSLVDQLQFLIGTPLFES